MGRNFFLQQLLEQGSVRNHLKNSTKTDTQSVSELSSILEKEFAYLANSASANVWYINSGASTHLTRAREHFRVIKKNEWTSKLIWETERSVL